MLKTIFDGFFMALADAVPGVSGGTVAWLLGFYERMIAALHDLFAKKKATRQEAICYLLRLLAGWLPGMCACVVLLSGLIEQNIYVMSSLFLGLTAAALPIVIYQDRACLRQKPFDFWWAIAGFAAVVGLCLLRQNGTAVSFSGFLSLTPASYLYLFFSGAFAISAMVLPGISGATVLLIAGVYLPAIDAAKALLSLQFAYLPGLAALGFGAVFGAALAVSVIKKALACRRSAVVFLVLGLLLGSLYAITLGPTTLKNPLPALNISNCDMLAAAIGFTILPFLELLRRRKLQLA